MNFHTLVNERNEWINHNFPGMCMEHCIEGVLEELGEFTHHRLKLAQRIRGDDEYHLSEMRDAIGDMTVFLLGVMARCGVPSPNQVYDAFNPKAEHFNPTLRMGVIVGNLCYYHTGVDAKLLRSTCGLLVGELERTCREHSWDYTEIVTETWNKVKQRDWVRYPTDGKTK